MRGAPMFDFCINNALIHFVPSCQDTCTQLASVLDPLLVDLLLHYGPHGSTGFKSGLFGGQSVGGMMKSGCLHCQQLNCLTYGLAYCLVETRESLTVEEYLAEVFAPVLYSDSIDR